uniref:Uncharacterized protein n=2 Tax=Chrysotila carterae TaxID=13221 RepID=A0A7S4BBR7_CHRCT
MRTGAGAIHSRPHSPACMAASNAFSAKGTVDGAPRAHTAVSPRDNLERQVHVCDEKLEQLRREYAALEAEYPKVNWRILSDEEEHQLRNASDHGRDGPDRTGDSSAHGSDHTSEVSSNHTSDRVSSVSLALRVHGASAFPSPALKRLPIMRPPMIRPPGYKIQSGRRSAPSWSLGERRQVHRNVDPLLPDHGPGPADYDVISATARMTHAPSWTMGRRIEIDRNVDPTVADDNPGPGAYALDKY